MSRNGRRDRGGRERGGRGGRELAMFGGGFDADPFSRMDEMMGGSMAGMFGGGERGRGGGGRELIRDARSLVATDPTAEVRSISCCTSRIPLLPLLTCSRHRVTASPLSVPSS